MADFSKLYDWLQGPQAMGIAQALSEAGRGASGRYESVGSALARGLASGQQMQQQQDFLGAKKDLLSAQIAEAKEKAEAAKQKSALDAQQFSLASQIIDPYLTEGGEGSPDITEQAPIGSDLFKQRIAMAQIASGQMAAGLKTLSEIGSTGEESTYEKELGKGEATSILDARETAGIATRTLGNISQFKGALSNLNTGVGRDLWSKVQSGANIVGLPGVNQETLASVELLKSLSKDFVLNYAKDMKGILSDKDIRLLQEATPGVSNSVQGNIAILNSLEAGAIRAQTKDDFLETFREQNGTLQGAERQWAKFVNDNPILNKKFEVDRWAVSGWEPYLNPRYSAKSTLEGDVNRLGG